MKPYYVEVAKKWVDLDSVLEICYPEESGHLHLPVGSNWFKYTLMFQDNYSIMTSYEYSGFIEKEKFIKECYEPFLEAWKNKDVINESK